ncbi:MAG: hypothetical protein Kow00114_38860 [Kiloniellaceae bacterium]
MILRAADGSETVWSEGTEYSLTGAGAPGGGTVTVSSSPVDHTPAAGETLVVKLAVPARQETALPLGGAFPSTAVEGMADLAALRDQQIEEALSRALKFGETTAVADVVLPEPAAGRVLAVNAAGDALVWRIPQEAAVPTGGGPGQVLRKLSTADFDAEWGSLGALAALGSVGAGQIDNGAVANAKLAAMAEATVKGRAAGAGSGDPQDLSPAQLLALLLPADGAGSGLDADTLDGNQAAAFQLVSEKGQANGYAGLDSGGKVPAAQLPDAVVGALNYRGTWNANSNSPALSGGGGGGSQGHYYRVATAGSSSLDGTADWQVGDYVVNNGSAWEKIDNTDQVVSVHGRQGAVVANSGDYNAGQITETAGAKIMTAAERSKLAGIAAGAEVNPDVPSQAQAEDGSSTTAYSWTPQRVHQAAKDAVPWSLIVAVGDETTALTTGTAKVTFRLPHAVTLTEVRASLTTESSSGNPTFDVNEDGVSILSSKLSIDAGETTSTTATSSAVISTASLADNAEITIDIDAAGTGAAGAKITLIGHKTTS